MSKNRLFLAILLVALALFGVYAANLSLLAVTYSDKKIGPWIGGNLSGSASNWAGQVFNGPAKHATAMVQTGVGALSCSSTDFTQAVTWSKDFAVASRSFDDGRIEISVVFAFGGCIQNEAPWTYLENTFIPTLKQGQPQLRYIGIEDEFSCRSENGCDRTRWVGDEAYRRPFYDRFLSLATANGFLTLHFAWRTISGNINYPRVQPTTFPTWGDPAVVLDPSRYTSAEITGAEFGVWASNTGGHGGNGVWDGTYADSCDCTWSQSIVNGVIDNWRLRTNQNGHFLFITGPTAAFKQKDGTVWDNAFQQWVRDRQQLYSDFAWVGKTGTPAPVPEPTPTPLSSSFTYALAGRSANFTGTASGGISPYAYSWNFGDGSTGAGQTVSHTYVSDGSYTTTLTATDNAGSTSVSAVDLTAASSSTSPSTGESTGGGGGGGGGYFPTENPLTPLTTPQNLPYTTIGVLVAIGTGIGVYFWRRRR